MHKLAEEFGPGRVSFIFIYTHEAHPGENYPHHVSFEQKLTHARAFRDHFGVHHPVLADALDGRCHRAYGSMPNMTWIIDRRGRPVYKGEWTEHSSIRDALILLTGGKKSGGQGSITRAPFHVDRVEFRQVDREAFNEGLKLSGPKAVREFAEQTERWRKKG